MPSRTTGAGVSGSGTSSTTTRTGESACAWGTAATMYITAAKTTPIPCIQRLVSTSRSARYGLRAVKAISPATSAAPP